MSHQVIFPGGTVDYHYGKDRNFLNNLAAGRQLVLVTDNRVHDLYRSFFEGADTIVIPSGESHKNLESLEYVVNQLIKLRIDRTSLLVGIGGGVITDLVGFVASVYMRGIRFGFIPTTLLAMVDASVGGKNGINLGLQKNMLGVIRHPEFILFDETFLATLPVNEWSNGFAEVIKYGCIFDSYLFDRLATQDLNFFRENISATQSLIRKCVDWKTRTVQEDEKEQGLRKLLNFGHTVGHAVEKVCNVSHGYAVSIGMAFACKLSEKIAGLDPLVTRAVRKILVRYQLPSHITFSVDEVMSVLMMDKKKKREEIDFIVLEQIGKASVATVSFDFVRENLTEFRHGNRY